MNNPELIKSSAIAIIFALASIALFTAVIILFVNLGNTLGTGIGI